MILFYIFILIISFYLLAKISDDYFVVSLDKIANKLKLSSEASGATLMAVGSSAPELFIAVIALLKPGDHEMIGMGTIVGSALFNVLVIVGASALVKKAILTWHSVMRDTIFYAFSILLLLYAFRDGIIEFNEAFIFVVLYIIYIISVINWKKIASYKDVNVVEDIGKGWKENTKKKWYNILKPFDKLLELFYKPIKNYLLVFLFSIFLIAGLSWILVESAVAISVFLGIPSAIVALTVLAVGTSVPDLISSWIVAKQGRGGMAISNAIGSNIFDILFGLGAPWFVFLLFSNKKIAVSTENLYSSVILLFATVIVIIFMLIAKRWKLGYRAGYFLIFLYILYLAWAISQIYI